jgi:hypothetical protein
MPRANISKNASAGDEPRGDDQSPDVDACTKAGTGAAEDFTGAGARFKESAERSNEAEETRRCGTRRLVTDQP